MNPPEESGLGQRRRVSISQGSLGAQDNAAGTERGYSGRRIIFRAARQAGLIGVQARHLSGDTQEAHRGNCLGTSRPLPEGTCKEAVAVPSADVCQPDCDSAGEGSGATDILSGQVQVESASI